MAEHSVGIELVTTGSEPDVRDILRSYTNRDPDQLRFQPARLLLGELTDSVVSPEVYLLDGDPAGHASVMYFTSQFERGLPVAPILVRVNPDAGGFDIIDGFHRLAGAAEAGQFFIDGLVVID